MVWPTARRLVLAAQIAGAVGLAMAVSPGLSWIPIVELNNAMPLLGILILVGAAFATSRTLQRSATTQNDSHLPAWLLLWSGIWWMSALNIAASRITDYLPAILGSMDSRWLALYSLAIVATLIACVRCARVSHCPTCAGLPLPAGLQWALLREVCLRSCMARMRSRTLLSGLHGQLYGWAADRRCCAGILTMLPIALWNLRHDGAMDPLPYLPLLNPLDLITGFVLMLWVSTLRQLAARTALNRTAAPSWQSR